MIELLAVIVILGILAAIAVPSVSWLIEKTKVDACNAEVVQVDRMYNMHLILADIDHSDTYFAQYIFENGGQACSNICKLSFVDGEVICEEKLDDIEEDEDNSGPFF